MTKGWSDPEQHAKLEEAEKAELELRAKKVAALANDLREFIALIATRDKMPMGDVAAALCEELTRALAIGAICSGAPDKFLKRYIEFFNECLNNNLRDVQEHPLGRLIHEIFGKDSSCSKNSSSEAAPPSSPSTSAESPSSSSSESKDG